MEQEIFAPLGITTAGFGPPGTPGTPDQPWGHNTGILGWRSYDPGSPAADNPPVLDPAGRVHISLEEYVLFIADQLAGARGADGLLKAATYATLHTSISDANYGLGWGVIQSAGGEKLLTHDGSNTMWYTSLILKPEKNEALVVVTNGVKRSQNKGVQSAIELLVRRLTAPVETEHP